MEKDFYIEQLEKWVETKKKQSLEEFVNLSNWNPSLEFMNKLAIDIPYTFVGNPVSYIFSSDYDNITRINILSKWGYNSEKGITFFNTGSESILNSIYLLSYLKYKRVYLLCPTYFSIIPICDSIGIECKKIFLNRKDDRYYLPDNFDKLIEKDCCIWITNPVYCTGNLYSEEDIILLKQIAIKNRLFIVNDESLCLRQYSISKYFESYEKIITIITPHKALCTNTLKFSAIIHSSIYDSIVDKWADTLEGCLGIGAAIAIKHFLSSEYDLYEQSFIKAIEENRENLIPLLNKYHLVYDSKSVSYLLSLYFADISYNFYDDMIKIQNLINKTNAYFISGSKNSFPLSTGFSFRINLCSIDKRYLYALERTIRYICEERL